MAEVTLELICFLANLFIHWYSLYISKCHSHANSPPKQEPHSQAAPTLLLQILAWSALWLAPALRSVLPPQSGLSGPSYQNLPPIPFLSHTPASFPSCTYICIIYLIMASIRICVPEEEGASLFCTPWYHFLEQFLVYSRYTVLLRMRKWNWDSYLSLIILIQ